jgi:hypothetical protein
MAINLTEANLYRTGAGESFVWGENRALRGLQQAQQQEQLRKQKEEAELADQMAKVSVEGVREQDLPIIMKDYNELKNTFAKIRGTQDQAERIRLQAQLNQQKALLAQKAGVSKEAKGQIADGYKLRFAKPDDVSDDYGNLIKDLDGTSTFDERFKEKADRFASGALAPKFDKLAFDKKVLDASIENLKESDVKKQDLGGGNISYYTEKGVRLNPNALLDNLANTIKADRGAMRMVTKLYEGLPIEKAVEQYAKDLYESSRGRYDKMDRTGASVTNPDLWKEKANYSDMLIRGRYRDGIVGGGAGVGEAEDLIVPFANGKGQTRLEGFVKVSIPSKNFAGSTGIDMATGQAAKLNEATNDYEVVGATNARFLPKGAKIDGKDASGALAQEGYKGETVSKPMILVQMKRAGGLKPKNILIPFDRMPQNLTKKDKEILSGFVPATQSKSTQAKPQSAPKVINKSDVASRANAAGYSVAEYTKLLKERGIKIQ